VLDQYNKNVNEVQLLEYLKGILPPKRLPQRIYFADYLPRLVNGRVMRRAVRPSPALLK
jgi:acyl-coenzyme A synthetase/AMP-(fatty) acid ligase